MSDHGLEYQLPVRSLPHDIFQTAQSPSFLQRWNDDGIMLLVIGQSTMFRCSTLTESDYLEVTGLAGGSSRRYCSTDRPPPPPLTATSGSSYGSQLRLTFESDDVYDATGFEASYEFSTFVPSMNTFAYLHEKIGQMLYRK